MTDFKILMEENMDHPGDFGVMGDTDVIIDLDSELENHDGGLETALVEKEERPTRVTFTDYLKSPVVELVLGEGDDQTLLTAHQALLVSSPFFEEKCSHFGIDTKVSRPFSVFHRLQLLI
jgi:hypothetical protein